MDMTRPPELVVREEGPPAGPDRPDRTRRAPIAPTSLGLGVLAATAMAAFYLLVVRGSSGSWTHVGDQIRQDWAYLAAIVVGFAVQVALVGELRRRKQLDASLAAAGGAGAGASTAGMVACCAHHIADLLPFVGATGAATFLIDYRIPFMLVGITVNGAGITIAARRLRRMNRHATEPRAPVVQPRHANKRRDIPCHAD